MYCKAKAENFLYTDMSIKLKRFTLTEQTSPDYNSQCVHTYFVYGSGGQ